MGDSEVNPHAGTQAGAGGFNPQVQGHISTGKEGGKINLGILAERGSTLDTGIPVSRADGISKTGNQADDRSRRANTQLGGGGINPQVQGNISANGGTINLGKLDGEIPGDANSGTHVHGHGSGTGCQPWTIFLTIFLAGVLVVAPSWLFVRLVVVTMIVLTLICAWQYIFFYAYAKGLKKVNSD